MDNSDDKNTVVAIGRPGLKINYEFDMSVYPGLPAGVQGLPPIYFLATSPVTRAMYVVNDDLYVVSHSTVWKASLNSSGNLIFSFVGSLHFNTGPCEIESNGFQVIITDNGKYIFIYTLATSTFAAMTDADYPYATTESYQSVCFLDSYILANKPGTPQFQWSASYDATSWDALDIATAESNPDKIVRIVTNAGYAYIFGTNSTEFFSTDFNGLSVIKGLTVSVGLAAVQSVSKVASGIMCLTTITNGVSQVSLVTPGQITKVSTNDLDTIINAYPDITDATGFSYVMNGHEFYQINFTAANKSWLYDLTMGLWSQVKSDNGRHFSEISAKFLNKTFTSDYRNGKIYFLDETINNDDGDLIEFELTSKHIFNGLEKVSIKSLQIDAETGLYPDTGNHEDSQMMISVSKDNGKSFVESFVSMGFPGETKKRCRKNRLGMARDWVFKIKITDRIKRVVLGAYVEIN